MPLEKESLNNFLPNGFETLNQEGYKENFNEDKIATGFERDVPDIVSGPNLNNLLDNIGKNTNVLTKFMDFIKNMPINNLFAVDENNQLVYKNLDEVGGGGLEIGDIGIAPLGIDETKNKRRYLNGQIIIQEQFLSFTTKLKTAINLYPTLACTESEWQATALLTVGGQVGKFVVDNDAGTIRLPKIIMPIQGLTDLSKLAEIVEAGLPNARIYSDDTDLTKYLSHQNDKVYNIASKSETNGNGVLGMRGTDNDHTGLYVQDEKGLYGNSNTVQQEQIQYPYFIQVATGAETEDNIINEIELNNPFSLLDYKFSEYELNNISWLRSNGQYNSKAVYPAVYDLLLKIYNGTETKAGVSVKLTTETFTDYDFVLNTAEETFRLPTKVKLASGKAVVGNGNAVGMLYSNDGRTVIEGGFRYKYDKDSSGFNIELATIGLPVVTPAGAQYTSETALANTPKNGTAVGITTDPTKSGIETSDSDLYLYFYVGETVQNANLINAGRIEEVVATRTDKVQAAQASMPSSRYIDLTLGASGTTYTAPANGWFVFAKVIGTANTYNSLQNLTSGVQTDCASSATGLWGRVYVPCKKGDEIKVEYKSTDETKIFRFIYAEGEV